MNDKEIYDMWQEAKGEGRSRQDLADELGMSLGAVRTAIYRGKRAKKEKSDPDPDASVFTNEAVVSSKTITTLEDLLAFHGLSLDEWEVTKVVANKWEVGRKETEQDIVWTKDGTIGKGSFSKDSGGIFKEPLHQIKAWLVRKEPVAIKPVLTPVHFGEVQFRSRPVHGEFDVRKTLVIADPQIGFRRNVSNGKLKPFHNRTALQLALGIAQMENVDEVIWAGDLLDLAEVSDKFVRSPEFWQVTQPAIYEASLWLKWFNDIVNKQIVLEGNHELRINTFLYKHMTWAYELRRVEADGLATFPVMSIPNLLGLDHMDIQWVDEYPNNRYWVNAELAVEHGHVVSSAPGGTAKKIVEDNGDYSVIFGHVHRYEVATRTSRNVMGEKVRVAMCPGALTTNATPGKKDTQNWNSGVALVLHNEHNFRIKHYPIQDWGVIMDDGKVLRPVEDGKLTDVIERGMREAGFF